jgi:hypothetical protein
MISGVDLRLENSLLRVESSRHFLPSGRNYMTQYQALRGIPGTYQASLM